MSNYIITNYTKKKATDLGVKVKPSKNPKKKIDVFKNGEKIATIGDVKYKDFPTYIKTDGKASADEHRRRYKIRHKKDLHSGNGYWANKLLW